MVCACGSTWRVEAVDARNGVTRALLHPMQFQIETLLNDVGRGSLTLTTRDTRPRDIWPHLMTTVIQRLEGDDAPVAAWHGLIEAFEASDNNTTTVGLHSIENWLKYRLVTDLTLRGMEQTDIGALLVNTAQTAPLLSQVLPDTYPSQPGIPLFGVAAPSVVTRDRTYETFEKVSILQRCQELTQVINGPDWTLRTLRYGTEDSVDLLDRAWANMQLNPAAAEAFSLFGINRDSLSPQNGTWVSFMIWEDFAGGVRDTIVASDREASGYSLSVDAETHGNIAWGVGEGEGEGQLTSVAMDLQSIYPIYEIVETWPTVSRQNTLDENTEGFLANYKEPVATPTVVIPGVDPVVDMGDTVTFDINFGALTYKGQCRVIGVSWEQGTDAPAQRTFTTLPITPASQSVLNQIPDETCEDC